MPAALRWHEEKRVSCKTHPLMNKTIVHHERATSLEVTVNRVELANSVIKLGVDIHSQVYVVVAQYDHLLPKPPRRMAPADLVPWVESLLGVGHMVHVVYEACGFGFGLYRQLLAAGAHCYVIAPRKLDEQRTGVKTDPRDAATLCQRLSRYVDGNTRELAVVRVPSQEQERARHTSRQRQQLVHHRQKIEAQGRGLLVSHGLPAPANWWKSQSWSQLVKLLPEWIVPHLELYRPILLALHQQITSLTSQLESTAPPNIPRGLGKLTTVTLSREICDWSRFNNRRTISSYTGLCPGEYSSGNKRVPGSVTKRGNPRLRAALVECAWRMVRFQPQYPPVKKRLPLLAKGSAATGAQRKKAIVAVARQLAVDLWRLHTKRCSAEQLGFKS
jgi:transposase